MGLNKNPNPRRQEMKKPKRKPRLPPVAEPMTTLDHCLAILKAIGVSEIQYTLDGEGDSGTTTLDAVHYLDGSSAELLPYLTIGLGDQYGLLTLDVLLDEIVAEVPDGDWVNNEGGYGTVTLRPQETDADLRVEYDMTYRECDDDFEDDGFAAEPPADFDGEEEAPLVIDDAPLPAGRGVAPRNLANGRAPSPPRAGAL
jgi:hypothetical protein